MNTNKSARSPLRSILRSRPLRIGAAIVLVGVAAEAWHVHLDAAPTIAIPPPAAMPVPNAYDDFVRIVAHNVELPADLWQPTRSGSVPASSDTGTAAGKPVQHVNTDADRRMALAKDEPSLTEMHVLIAAHRPFRLPVQRAFLDEYEPLARFRSLARSMAFEERMRESDGDYAGAVTSGLDDIEFGALVPNGGGITAREYGATIEGIGRRRLWEMVAHLNADQAAAAAARLEGIDESRPSLVESMTEEKWKTVWQIRDLLHKDTTFGTYHALRTSDPSDPTKNSGFSGLFAPTGYDASHESTPTERRAVLREMSRDWRELMTHSKSQIVDDTARLMDLWIAEANLPFAETAVNPFHPHDPLNRALFPEDGMRRPELYAEARTRVNDGILTLAFALRAYRVQNGTEPDSLDRLVETGILHHLPTDPFALSTGAGFRYHHTDADHFLLYSVGPDGIDEGGRSVPKHSEDDQVDFRQSASERGDWVFAMDAPHDLPRP